MNIGVVNGFLFNMVFRGLLGIVMVQENGYFIYKLRNFSKLVNFFKVLKNSYLFLFELLLDLTAVHYVDNVEFTNEIYYNIYSYFLNKRVLIKLAVNINSIYFVESLSSIYKSCSWLEREVWDMFGIFFWNHIDLRRILTDYGFKGFPLRKDFPLSGFYELRYDDFTKVIQYELVKLTQDYRNFLFLNPWNVNIKFK